MSDQRLPPIAELPHRIREGLAGLPVSVRQWRDELAQDPAAVWRNPVTRIALWVVLGIALLFAGQWAIRGLAPGGARDPFEKPTPWATLYVACTRDGCRASYFTQQAMDFKTWPLKCEKCGEPAVYRARLCNVCRTWFTTAPGAPRDCPNCAAAAAEQERKREAPKRPKSTNPDDDEDA